MLRTCRFVLLPAVLLLFSVPDASAQWSRPYPDFGHREPYAGDLSGPYLNTSSGIICHVYRRWGGYIFINDQGLSERFVFSGPDRLQAVSGPWDPNTYATVQRDGQGRITLCFGPGQPIYWVAQ